MIPDAAVEAAAISLYFDDISAEFPGEHPESRDACLRAARKALEAAAPHMLAEFEKQRKYAALDAISDLGSDHPNEQMTKRTTK